MKLEDQVCSLEQAKRLKELGVEQKEAHYFWDEHDETIYRCVDGSAADIGCYAAYTVAELGEMLPCGYDTMKVHSDIEPTLMVWRAYNDEGADFFEYEFGTEAKCRAELLIELLKTTF